MKKPILSCFIGLLAVSSLVSAETFEIQNNASDPGFELPITPSQIQEEMLPEIPIEAVGETNIQEPEPVAEEPILEPLDTSLSLQSDLFLQFLQSDPSAPNAEAVKPDPLKTLASAQGKYDIDLFSGSPSYSFPITLPPGRDGATPKLSLNYSANNRKFDSLAGYGWNITQNAIYRSTKHGSDQLYSRNDFTAELNGQAQELVLIDTSNQIYGAKTESAFTQYKFLGDHWIATDTEGTKYIFGQQASARQDDPEDTQRVYKWLLERIEDLNGNYVTYSYTKNGGQIYPESIRYTGHGEDPGIGEVKFLLTDRPAYTSFERGFRVTTNKIINSIETYTYHDGGVKRILKYDFGHEIRNNAVQHLSRIEMKSPDGMYPPTEFSYFDGTEDIQFKKINLIKEIRHPYGAIQSFTFRPSTGYRPGGNLSNKIPFVIHTLYTDNIKPEGELTPIEKVQTTTYEYYGGHYYYDQLDAYKKEYAGFHEVIETDPIGNITKHYYHQSENSVDGSVNGEYADHIAKKGREYRTEVFDNAYNLYELTLQKWNKKVLPNDDPENDRNFIYVEGQLRASYDGDADYRATASESDYDDWGNIVASRDYGEVTLENQTGDFTDIGEDRINQTLQYAQNEDKYLYGFSSQSETTDFDGNLIAKETRYYDELPFGEVRFGNLTKKEQLADTSGTILTSTIEYDEHGLPIKFTNPRGYASTVTYDSHHFFPHSMTNALGQTVWYTYDMRFGIQNSFTDANGAATSTTYDDFGRAIETRMTDPQNPAQEVTVKTIAYNLNTIPASTTETTFTGNNGISIVSKTYLDGLGRTKQTRVESDETRFIVANQLYDKRGNIKKQFLPVFETGIDFTPIDENALGTVMSYDALGRITKTETPVGITTKTYDQWTETTIDANGNQKDHIKDARGNLVAVYEYLDGQKHTTTYTYNPLNQLVKIIDALGNIRNMTYDLRGKKLTDEDLHSPTDATFGVRSFQYDANGNLIQSLDAKGNEVQLAYDEIGRVISEDFQGQEGIETSYTYDQGAYGLGRLSGVTTPDIQKTFSYDIHGKVLENKYLIDGQIFSLSFVYDWLGDILSITYPDTKDITYEYDTAAKITGIKVNNADVITNVNYSPMGAVAQLEYANGTITIQTFDPAQMYRMTHKETIQGSNKLQDMAYAYDPAGNILSITDTSDTNAAKISTYEYDDLYRLTKATITNTANNEDYIRDFTYDIIGNILSRSDIGTYEYAGISNPESVYATPHAATTVGTKTFTYDKNGNITSDGDNTLTWDYKNRMQSSTNSQNTVMYTYDESTNRIKKDNITDGIQTYYIDKYYDLEDTTGKAHFYLGNLKVGTIKTKN